MPISPAPSQSPIKSIQTYSIVVAVNVSGTATITSVNTSKAVIIPSGQRDPTTSTASVGGTHVLTNATTVTCTAQGSSGADSLTMTGSVVEYN